MWCFAKKKTAPQRSTRQRLEEQDAKKKAKAAEKPEDAGPIPAESTPGRKSIKSVKGSAKGSAKGSLQDFTRILDGFWAEQIAFSPLLATTMGYHENDDKMDDETEESYEAFKDVCQAYLEELESLFPESNKKRFEGWSQTDKSTFLVLRAQLKSIIRGIELKSYILKTNTLEAAHLWMPMAFEKMKFANEKDFEVYRKRLEAVPQYLDNITKLLERGLEVGVMQPRVVLASMPPQIQGMVSAEVNFFQQLVNDHAEKAGVSAPLLQAVEDAIEDKVLPALLKFANALADMAERVSEETALPKRLEQGEEMYSYMIELHTTTTMTPQEIHDLGLAEVKRIRETMRQIAKDEGFGEGEDAVDLLKAHLDEKCVAKSEEELIAHYQAVAMDIMPRLPELFGLLPRTPFGVRPVPAYAAKHAPGAYYEPPPLDLSHPGWFSLNTSFLPSRKTYLAEALVAHEACPGHHLQIALNTENEDLHAFRRYTYHNAYVEGWGLYSECLGFELGLYTTAEGHFGRLMAETLRASRLVVDTGMNYFGWTKQEALDFMIENKAGSFEECNSETTRYLGMPGQALAYKIGEIKLRELRARAEKKLAAKFDIRAFHDLVLGLGSVPLSVLEDIIDQWIEDQQ